MSRYQYQPWSTFKTLFGYRNRHYQSVSQIEFNESKDSVDESTSCMEDRTMIDDDKSSVINPMGNVNTKQIDEILPLVNEKSFDLKILVPPITSYTNDTRPDVDLLEC